MMISYGEALSVLEGLGAKHGLGYELVKLDSAVGRVLSADVVSPEEVPSFTNSAMDGFAVFASDTAGASRSQPIRLRVRGIVAAGDLAAFREAATCARGESVEIMTGAPVPECGFDAVVKIEDVTVERDSSGAALWVTLERPLRTGENVRLRGTDFTRAARVIGAGVRVTPEHVLACASLGLDRLRVKALPRVAIVSTGSELVAPSEPSLAPGMIRNSTGPFLVAAFRRLGVEARYLGIVRDDPALYRRTLEGALAEGADVILSTGAVSMGKFDFVPEVLAQLGAETFFHKAAIRPGKPVLLAEFPRARGGAVFFGVPGNPVSTAVGMRFFVEPFLRAALGLERESPLRARLSSDCAKPDGLRCFFKGRSSLEPHGLSVETLKGQASYVVSALLDANCWAVLEERGERVEAGAEVSVYPLYNGFERGVVS